jgi:hypothetical protein
MRARVAEQQLGQQGRAARRGQAQQGLALRSVGDAEGHGWVRERQLQHALAAGVKLPARPAAAVPVSQVRSRMRILAQQGPTVRA